LDNNEKETFRGSFPQVDPRYAKVLAARQVPREEWREHQKWVRYYLHFCNEDSPPQAAEYLIPNDFFLYVASDGVFNPCYAKYRHIPDDPESIPFFIGKLASKNQTSTQQDQARRAIEFYSVLLGLWK